MVILLNCYKNVFKFERVYFLKGEDIWHPQSLKSTKRKFLDPLIIGLHSQLFVLQQLQVRFVC